MATESEEVRVPLLASRESSLLDDLGELKDDLEVRYPLPPAKKELYWTERVLDGRGSHLQQGLVGANNGGLKRVGSEASSSRKRKQYSGSEMIVAVFVVAFDTKKGEPAINGEAILVVPFPPLDLPYAGNIVEWKYPSEVMLEGIEFKSMASGLHKITKDFM